MKSKDEKVLVIHQPNPFPRLKVLQKISMANFWVVYDDVQFVSREWQNRVILRQQKNPNESFWLTIPVLKKDGRRTKIMDIKIIDPERASINIYKKIKNTYCRSQHWNWIDKYLEKCLDGMTESLSDFSVRTVVECFNSLELPIEYCLSSKMNASGAKNDRLIDICKYLEYENYLTGSGGMSYLDCDKFVENQIRVKVQLWKTPVETLNWKNVTFIDYVARYGPENLLHHIS